MLDDTGFAVKFRARKSTAMPSTSTYQQLTMVTGSPVNTSPKVVFHAGLSGLQTRVLPSLPWSSVAALRIAIKL